MIAPLITLDQVQKRFGYRLILQAINAEIQPGEFILLLGNNGAGKTTLTRLICALMHPSRGSLRFKGKDYHEALEALRLSLGTVSHESRLYGDLTAQENLKVFGTLYGAMPLASRINEALEQVELSHAAHLPVRTFSSGMTKRLAIARLLLYRPELLVLDEPYTGLDAHSTEAFQRYLRDYHQQGGTVLMITHQFSLGLELAQRLWILQQGRIAHDLPALGVTPEQCALWLDTR